MNASTHRIPPGTYRGVVVADSAQYGETSNGNDQIVLDLNLVDINERVSTFLVFTDKAAPYSMQRLRRCGFKGNDLTNLGKLDQEVPVEVSYETYQGEEKMKVQISVGGAVVLKTQHDDKGKRAFGAKYANLAAKTPMVATANSFGRVTDRTSKGGAPAQASFGGDDVAGDDIPF